MEIVLTGGPCGGKSSAVRHLVAHLSARGWRTLVVPEAATLLITGGVHDIGRLAQHDRPAFLEVQRHLVALQSDLRARFLGLARDLTRCPATCNPDCEAGCHEAHQPAHKQAHAPDQCPSAVPAVVLYDRAELDNRAYMDEAEFTGVLDAALGLSAGQVAARYDAVVHMVTAADGAEGAYSTANNEARTETPERAIALDRAVQAAWLGHPHLVVVGNDGSFDQKLTRTLAAVLNILGEPEPVEIERKWLLARSPSPQALACAVPVDIEQIYLPADEAGAERRVRARTHEGFTTYFHTTKSPTADGQGRVERESVISGETYRLLAGMKEPGTRVIRKRRYCFVHAGQHFELDHLVEPVEAWLLEAELVTAGDPVSLPGFLDVAAEVTEDPAWRNGSLARGGLNRNGA